MKNGVKHLDNRGFVVMPYPTRLRQEIIKTTELWQKFCSLPLETKKSLPYSNKAAGVGYEFKDRPGTKGDLKENFDLALEGERWLRDNISTNDFPGVSKFVHSALRLAEEIEPLVIDFAQQAEKEFGLKDFAQEVESSVDRFFIRFIHYPNNSQVGSEVATAHTDQSGFTLHLFESDRGLQCLTKASKWINMPVAPGQTVVIPAMQMQLRSEGHLKALCHRVVSTPKTAVSGRYSAVCFVQLKHTPKYNKEVAGRLQEKVPGFNYHMPFDEFSKLFK